MQYISNQYAQKNNRHGQHIQRNPSLLKRRKESRPDLQSDRIYKKYHHVETVIGWDEISPKEEAEYLATQDKIQLNDGLLTELQIDVLTKREREIITLMFENSLTAAEIARRWGCSRQSVNQGKIVALKKLRKTFSTPISTKTLHNIERAKR